MQQQDIIKRIKELCAARSWTYYRLAKESGITYSTLNTMLNKTTAPSLPTLMKICDGFGITLAEFFGEDPDAAKLTEDEKRHLTQRSKLSPENRRNLDTYMAFLISLQDESNQM